MGTDYKEQILLRLKESNIYNTLVEKCGSVDPEVIAQIHKGVEFAYQKTKSILIHMKEYTLHDSDHLFRVLHLMGKLIGPENLKNYSIPELQLLILSAFFHDIGMAPDEFEVLAWKKNFDMNPELSEGKETDAFYTFQRYYNSIPDYRSKIGIANQVGDSSLSDRLKDFLIAEFIRKTHAERARQIIESFWVDKVKFRGTDLTVALATLCFGHNESTKSLLNTDKHFPCGDSNYISMPVLGVILRLADILDFDSKRTPEILFNHLLIKSPISKIEWQKHRSIESWEIDSKIVSFSAICEHPVIQGSIYNFCDIIDDELIKCNYVINETLPYLNGKRPPLNIVIPSNVNRENIKTKTDIGGKPIYLFRNTKFELSKKQVIELLMGTKLYGSHEVALRELIQNSIDACLLRQAQELKWGNGSYTPEIEIKLIGNGIDYYLEVNDNGTGMDQYIIDNYYSKIGSSFYKSADFYYIKDQSGADFHPTSRFGIGILSSFMISDTIEVETRRITDSHTFSEPFKLRIEGQESIFYITASKKQTPGTNTKLAIRKDQNPWKNLSPNEFIKYVEKLIPVPPFNITVYSMGQIMNLNNKANVSISIELDALKDNTWNVLTDLIMYEFPFDENGLRGKARIAVLNSNGIPVNEIILDKKTVVVDNANYDLDKKAVVKLNKIDQEATIISLDQNQNVFSSKSISEIAKSKCSVSYCGINVPHILTPNSWEIKPNLAILHWPIQMLLILDISNKYDIDLNSPRTEILEGTKWETVEKELAKIILSNLKTNASNNWEALKKVYNNIGGSVNFLNALNEL